LQPLLTLAVDQRAPRKEVSAMSGIPDGARLPALAPDRARHEQRQATDRPRVAQRLAPSAVARRSRSLEYGLILLECLTAERPALRVSDIADLLHVNRSTAHRYASTLVRLGWLQQDTKRRYQLTTNAAGPGAAALASIRREVRAQSILEDLREKTGHSVGVGLLDGLDVLCLYRYAAHRAGQYEADGPIRPGARFAAPYTPLGMALLSALTTSELLETLAKGGPENAWDIQALIGEVDAVKQSGIATGPNQHATACVIAAPVARWAGSPVLAVEIIAPNGIPTAVEQLGGLVKHTAKLISE
jgi:DNA-binding IclR family transcriptional regulator